MQPAGTAQERLAALVTRLRQLTELRTAQTQPAPAGDRPGGATKSFEEMLGLIASQIRAWRAEIADLIDGDPLWRKLDKTFRSIKGVADRTVAHLMAELPEIGTFPNKAVPSSAASPRSPMTAARYKGKRSIRGGRSSIRSILFVVAEIVRRYDPDFAAFHKRLSDAGKPKKVIRIALAHKLLVRLNAKARDVRNELASPLDKPDSRSPRPSPPPRAEREYTPQRKCSPSERTLLRGRREASPAQRRQRRQRRGFLGHVVADAREQAALIAAGEKAASCVHRAAPVREAVVHAVERDGRHGNRRLRGEPSRSPLGGIARRVPKRWR